MPMILSGSLKGGSGKTTLAVNLAVMRVRAGHSVLLVDADPQESASMWASVRSENHDLPAIVCVIMRPASRQADALAAVLLERAPAAQALVVRVGVDDDQRPAWVAHGVTR